MDIATQEPTQITQGTTIKWKRLLSKYPASAGWGITYYFVGAAKFTISSTADGDDHLVSVGSTVSSGYRCGDYNWQAYVGDGTDRYLIRSGSMKVLVDFANAPEGFDDRSHARKMVEAIEKTLEGSAGTDVQSYTIGGRSISRISKAELIQLHTHYKALVVREDRARDIKRGLRTNRFIGTRFK